MRNQLPTRLVRSAVVGGAIVWLATRATMMAVNHRFMPHLALPEDPQQPGHPAGPMIDPGAVQVLIPARQEGHHIADAVRALVGQGAKVIVLDDESSDDTASQAAAAGAQVVAGQPLPPGWTGKNWACEQAYRAAYDLTNGGDEATSPVVIFTDADVQWSPGSLAAVLELRATADADLVSVFAQQRPGSLGERLITPLIDAAVLGFVPLAFPRDPLPVVSNGQVMCFNRAAYEELGGHGSVRETLVEDVALAERVRDHGGRVVVTLGKGLVGVRMYCGYRDSVAGLAKSILGLHRDSRRIMAGAWILSVIGALGPWLLRPSPLVWVVRLLGLADRGVVAAATGRLNAADLAEGALGPISPLLVLPAYLRAWYGRLDWRGRRYQ